MSTITQHLRFKLVSSPGGGHDLILYIGNSNDIVTAVLATNATLQIRKEANDTQLRVNLYRTISTKKFPGIESTVRVGTNPSSLSTVAHDKKVPNLYKLGPFSTRVNTSRTIRIEVSWKNGQETKVYNLSFDFLSPLEYDRAQTDSDSDRGPDDDDDPPPPSDIVLGPPAPPPPTPNPDWWPNDFLSAPDHRPGNNLGHLLNHNRNPGHVIREVIRDGVTLDRPGLGNHLLDRPNIDHHINDNGPAGPGVHGPGPGFDPNRGNNE